MTWFLRFPFVMRAVFALILGLGLAGAGAAHRPMERPAEIAALAAFLAAGGDLADLCHDAGDHGGGHARTECPACTLQAGLALPVIDPVQLPVPQLAQQGLWPAQVAAFLSAHPTRLPPARGPPVPTLS
jgi:hypothetical protein